MTMQKIILEHIVENEAFAQYQQMLHFPKYFIVVLNWCFPFLKKSSYLWYTFILSKFKKAQW